MPPGMGPRGLCSGGIWSDGADGGGPCAPTPPAMSAAASAADPSASANDLFMAFFYRDVPSRSECAIHGLSSLCPRSRGSAASGDLGEALGIADHHARPGPLDRAGALELPES